MKNLQSTTKEILLSAIPEEFKGEVIVAWKDEGDFFSIETSKGCSYYLDYEKSDLIHTYYTRQIHSGLVYTQEDYINHARELDTKEVGVDFEDFELTDEDMVSWIKDHKPEWKKLQD